MNMIPDDISNKHFHNLCTTCHKEWKDPIIWICISCGHTELSGLDYFPFVYPNGTPITVVFQETICDACHDYVTR